MAENSLERGHERSAGEAYLRAANYYRAALIRQRMFDWPDEHI